MINIIYRCSDLEIEKETFKENRPDWFDKRKCFKSLVDSIKNNDVDCNIKVVHDGDENGKLISYIKKFDVEILNISCRSNSESLVYCCNLADTLDDKIYFLEDDYLHSNESIKIINEGLDKFGLVTVYDHPDRYIRDDDITKGKEEISTTTSCHWRTHEATTGTFALTKNMWSGVSEPAKRNLKGTLDRNFFREIYLNLNIRLWGSIYGRSTHMNKYQLGYFVDWKNINNNIKGV